MKSDKNILLFFFSIIMLFGVECAVAQDLPWKAQSPVINQDNSVTINLYLPKASKVLLKGSFVPQSKSVKTPAGVFGKEGSYEMERSSNGLWSYTTAPLNGEMYTYYFEADGVAMTDPKNPNKLRQVNDFYSFFIIDEGIGADYIQHDVPHGKVEQIWYPSSLKKLPQRRLSIYFPPSYNSSISYPVLYLLHGSGGNELSWVECGRAAQILDNLIFQERCVPMVVVMPNGIANAASAPLNDSIKVKATNLESMKGVIEKSFQKDIINFIESTYPNVGGSKDLRAIAGLSLGGLHTLYISANYPDMFDYVGLFSAQTVPGRVKNIMDYLPFLKNGKLGTRVQKIAQALEGSGYEMYDNLDAKLKEQFSQPPKLYYIAVGEDDFVLKINDDFRAVLDAGGYKYEYHQSGGGHTWENWRSYLVDFLPRLFR